MSRGNRGNRRDRGDRRDRGGPANAAGEARSSGFWARLPVGELLPEESALRDALLAALAEAPACHVRLSIASSRDDVRAAKDAIGLPAGSMSRWIKERMSTELSTVSVPGKESVLCVPGYEEQVNMAEHDDDQQAQVWFESLPAELTEEESNLRDLLVATLQNVGSPARLSVFNRGEHSKEITAVRNAVLPKGLRLGDYIERRLARFISIADSPEGPGQGKVAYLIGAPTMPMRGGMMVGMRGAGKGLGKIEKDPASEFVDDAARDEVRQARDQKIKDFLEHLPSDDLLPEEHALRESMLEVMFRLNSNPTMTPTRLSIICQEDQVRKAKMNCLPPDCPMVEWIENRIGAELVVQHDGTGQREVILSSTSPAVGHFPIQAQEHHQNDLPFASGHKPDGEGGISQKLARETRMAEYFVGPLKPTEQVLKRAMINTIRRLGSAPIRIGTMCNADPELAKAWQQAKMLWGRENPPVQATLASWVELRMKNEIQVTREPYVQFHKEFAQRSGFPLRQGGGGGGSKRKVMEVGKGRFAVSVAKRARVTPPNMLGGMPSGMQNGMQNVMQGVMQGGMQGGMQSGMHGGMGGMHSGMPSQIQPLNVFN